MNSQKGEQVTTRYLKVYIVNYTFFIRKLPNRKPAKNTWYKNYKAGCFCNNFT